jgi:malate dehydrogenase (oxaloacetate-decarboxylating)
MNKVLELHKKGKIEITSKIKIKNNKDLSLAYTPSVAQVSQLIAKNKDLVYNYTSKKNLVAIITDGSAVLGLGNIGPEAALPVMEGKSILFKKFANVDAFPICLNTQDSDEIIKIVKAISPSFAAINLEDISAPRCFYIEEKLRQQLDIPIFHDDQHGTAIVVLAALLNALKVTNKKFNEIKIVINGAGAAGIAITKMLLNYTNNIIICDRLGIIYKDRKKLDFAKEEISLLTNKDNIKGNLNDALKDVDVFIGVSSGNVLNENSIKLMNKDPIIFALANPIPEIMPNIAKKAGAKVIATGRSDFPNQVNNALAFPGVFRGLLDIKAKYIDNRMKKEAAIALASLIKKTTKNNIIPSVFDKRIVPAIAKVIKESYI